MGRGLPSTRRAAPQLHPCFFLQAFRSLPHLRGKPLAAAKASPSFALAPALLASLLAPPNTATPPRSAPLPARISQSIVPGRHRADRLLRPLAISRQRASPSPVVPTIPLAKFAPSIILHHCRHQPRGKVLSHAVNRRLIFQRGHGNHVDALWQRVASPRHVIPAPRQCQRQSRGHSRDRRPSDLEFHAASFSASFTAFATGSLMLSTAPQLHHACSGLSSGNSKCIVESPTERFPNGPSVFRQM